MKSKVFLFIFLFIAPQVTCLAIEQTTNEWYPFVLSERLDPKSPANIGRLVLDPPSGKHGFINAKNGHFYFKDGTRAKFWGTNLCFGANFPSKKDAEEMADRLAFFGFNAVRIHAIDLYFKPRGIFIDIPVKHGSGLPKETLSLSKEQLDKLDYLIYQLKKRGIYINFNLLVSRNFTKADGVINSEELVSAAKPISMFDPKLIKLQKNYARDLLTHYNKYTKLRYSDDPAIALIEIINESSIITSWEIGDVFDAFGSAENTWPEYYSLQLDDLWNNWLIEKYKKPKNAKEAWTSNHAPDRDHKKKITQKLKWHINKYQGAKASIGSDNETAIVTVAKITPTPWDLTYGAANITLSKEKKYLLKFNASADKDMTILAGAQQTLSPWTNLGLPQTLRLSTTTKTYQYSFIPTIDCNNSSVGFAIGYEKGEIRFSDIEIYEINTIPQLSEELKLKEFKFSRPPHKLLPLYPDEMRKDIKQFYIDIEKRYFNEMKDFLKAECEVKVPITGIGGWYTLPGDIEAQEELDFIDIHVYWDDPQAPNNPRDDYDFKIHNKSMILDKNLGMIGEIIKRQKIQQDVLKTKGPKPFTISEWNHNCPNQYAYEAPVLIASYAVKNNWDALFQFAYSNGLEWYPIFVFDNIQSHFEIIANAQQLILNSLGSFIFNNSDSTNISVNNGIFKLSTPTIKGIAGTIKDNPVSFEYFHIKSNQDGAVFLYSPENKPLKKSNKLILVVISEIKNTDSGWRNDGRFNPGIPPTLLKKMDVQIEIKSDRNKSFRVYEMTLEGKRGKKIKSTIKNKSLIFSTQKSNSPWFEISAM